MKVCIGQGNNLISKRMENWALNGNIHLTMCSTIFGMEYGAKAFCRRRTTISSQFLSVFQEKEASPVVKGFSEFLT